MKERTWPGSRLRAGIALLLAALLLGQGAGLLTRETPAEVPAEAVPEAEVITGTVWLQGQCLPGEAGDWTALAEPGQRVTRGQALFCRGTDRASRLPALSREAAALSLPERRARLHGEIAAFQGENPDPEALLALVLETPPEAAAPSETAPEVLASPAEGIFTRRTENVLPVVDPAWLCPPRGELPREGSASPGAVITGERWYLAAELPFSVEPGDRLTGYVLSGIFAPCRFTVEACLSASGGARAVMSCKELLSDVSGLTRVAVKFENSEIRTGNFPPFAVYCILYGARRSAGKGDGDGV